MTLQHDIKQNKLEGAQNVLSCKELLCQLARVWLQAPILCMHVGMQITASCSMFPHIQIIICHFKGRGSKKGVASNLEINHNEHNHVLEHSLHQVGHRDILWQRMKYLSS